MTNSSINIWMYLHKHCKTLQFVIKPYQTLSTSTSALYLGASHLDILILIESIGSKEIILGFMWNPIASGASMEFFEVWCCPKYMIWYHVRFFITPKYTYVHEHMKQRTRPYYQEWRLVHFFIFPMVWLYHVVPLIHHYPHSSVAQGNWAWDLSSDTMSN